MWEAFDDEVGDEEEEERNDENEDDHGDGGEVGIESYLPVRRG